MFSLRPAHSRVALRSLGRLFGGKATGPTVFNRLAEDNKHKQHVPGTCPDYDDLDAGTLPPKRVSSALPPAQPSAPPPAQPPRPSPIQSPAEPPTPPRAALPPPPPATGNPPAGSVFRYNVMTHQWVVFASGRQGRPKQTVSTPAGRLTTTAQAPHLDECPFCLGNESMTPTTLFQLPHPSPGDDGGASPWELRVVPNKYPAVSAMVDRLATAACGGGGDGDGDGGSGSGGGGGVTMEEWYRPAGYSNNAFSDPEGRLSGDTPCVTTEIPAHGHHEVVVEGPSHNQPLAARDGEARVGRLLEAWHSRAAALTEDSLIEHVMYFKNQGGIAGASLMHPHSQIVGVPFVPRNVKSAQRRHHEVRN